MSPNKRTKHAFAKPMELDLTRHSTVYHIAAVSLVCVGLWAILATTMGS